MPPRESVEAMLARIAAAGDAAVAELRGLRADLRRQHATATVRAAVAAGVAEELGDAPFTSPGLCSIADENRSGELAVALSAVVDLDSPHRAVALGVRLRAWRDEFEALGEYQRGLRLFRLRKG